MNINKEEIELIIEVFENPQEEYIQNNGGILTAEQRTFLKKIKK